MRLRIRDTEVVYGSDIEMNVVHRFDDVNGNLAPGAAPRACIGFGMNVYFYLVVLDPQSCDPWVHCVDSECSPDEQPRGEVRLSKFLTTLRPIPQRKAG